MYKFTEKLANSMTIKYANPENKVFSGIIVSGVDRKKILKSLSSKKMGQKSLAVFSNTLKIAKKLSSRETQR